MKRTILAVVILVAGIVALGLFGGAYVLMLVLGGLSHMLAVKGLALGFWTCVLVSLLLNIVGGYFTRSK